MGYGTAQRLAFAGLVIGFLMCTAGTCAPFWKHAEIEVNTLARLFSITIPIFGSTKLVTIDIGLWWYCREYLDDKKCEMYEIKQEDSAITRNINCCFILQYLIADFLSEEHTLSESYEIWTYRIASVVSVFVSLICALVGLCQICCSSGGQTIGHGVIAFLAGGAGIVTIAVFVTSQEDDDSLSMIDTSYAWAFYVYVVGTAIIVFVSFLLCFAAPENSVGQVFPATTAGNTIVVANSTQQMQSFGPQQYAYPNQMYTGPSNAPQYPNPMYTGPSNAPQYPNPMYTGPSNAPQYPNPMYTGPSKATHAGPHQTTDLKQPPNHPFSTQPQINNENMSKHDTWD